MFQPLHLLFMALSAVAITVFCIFIKRKTRATQTQLLRAASVLMACFDPIYWVWEYQSSGVLDPSTSLPFYLCSLFWLMLPFAAFCKEGWMRRAALANICTIGLFGGVFGMVFNVYLNRYPFFSFVPLRSLLYHFMMILIAAALWTSGYYTPRLLDTLLCFVPVTLLLVPCIIGNRLYGWDYGYINGGVGTPLEILSRHMPKGVFVMFFYGALFVLINLAFYLPTIRCALKQRKEKAHRAII